MINLIQMSLKDQISKVLAKRTHLYLQPRQMFAKMSRRAAPAIAWFCHLFCFCFFVSSIAIVSAIVIISIIAVVIVIAILNIWEHLLCLQLPRSQCRTKCSRQRCREAAKWQWKSGFGVYLAFLQHLVVVLVVVVVVPVDSRLYGKVPGAQLVAHVKQPSKCSGSNFWFSTFYEHSIQSHNHWNALEANANVVSLLLPYRGANTTKLDCSLRKCKTNIIGWILFLAVSCLDILSSPGYYQYVKSSLNLIKHLKTTFV